MRVGERIQALWARTEPFRTRWLRTEAGAHRHLETGEGARRTHEVRVYAGLTGAVVGLLVVFMNRAMLDWLADPMSHQPLWLRAAGPAIGLVVAWAALGILTDKATPDTTDEYVRSFHRPPADG